MSCTNTIQLCYTTGPCTSSTGDKWALCYRRLSGVIVSGCLEEILAYDGHMYPHSAAAVVPLPERNYENYDGGWRIWRIVMVNWAEWHNLHSGSEYWIVMRKTLLHSTNYYIIHKYYLGKPSKKVISKISLRSLIFLMYNKSMSPLPLQLECVSMSAAELELEILICWVI